MENSQPTKAGQAEMAQAELEVDASDGTPHLEATELENDLAASSSMVVRLQFLSKLREKAREVLDQRRSSAAKGMVR